MRETPYGKPPAALLFCSPMKTTNETPAETPNRAALIASGLASFRAKAEKMESVLAVPILYGQGFAVIMREPFPHNPAAFCVRALARVDPVTREYRVDAPRCFPSLDLLSDTFQGLCLFSPEAARRIIDAQRAKDYPKGTTFEARHIRDIQKERLEMARDMVKTLEKCAAALPAEERAGIK